MTKDEPYFDCCFCGAGPILWRIHASCIHCDHHRCASCPQGYGLDAGVPYRGGPMWDPSSSPLLSALANPQIATPGGDESASDQLDLVAPVAGLITDDEAAAAVDQHANETSASEPLVAASPEPSESDSESNGASTATSTPSSTTLDSMSIPSEEQNTLVMPDLPSRNSPREAVIQDMITLLRRWLHAHLRRTAAGSPSLGESSGTNDVDSPPEGNASSSTAQSRRGEASKRKRTNRRRDDGDDDKKRRRQGTSTGSSEPVKLFACHFWKRKPRIYQGRRWKTCQGPCPGWTEVHRIKQHLLEKHASKPRCVRCGEQFDSQVLVDAHLRREEICTPRRHPGVTEGISATMQNQLKRRTGVCKMTPEGKWVRWYKIIFPHDDHNSIPSPYYVANQPALSQYESFIRYDLVAEVEVELEQIVPAQLLENIPELTGYLRDAVRTVHGRFVTSQISNGLSDAFTMELMDGQSGSAQTNLSQEMPIGGTAQGAQDALSSHEQQDIFNDSFNDFLSQLGASNHDWTEFDDGLIEHENFSFI